MPSAARCCSATGMAQGAIHGWQRLVGGTWPLGRAASVDEELERAFCGGCDDAHGMDAVGAQGFVRRPRGVWVVALRAANTTTFVAASPLFPKPPPGSSRPRRVHAQGRFRDFTRPHGRAPRNLPPVPPRRWCARHALRLALNASSPTCASRRRARDQRPCSSAARAVGGELGLERACTRTIRGGRRGRPPSRRRPASALKSTPRARHEGTLIESAFRPR